LNKKLTEDEELVWERLSKGIQPEYVIPVGMIRLFQENGKLSYKVFNGTSWDDFHVPQASF